MRISDHHYAAAAAALPANLPPPTATEASDEADQLVDRVELGGDAGRDRVHNGDLHLPGTYDRQARTRRGSNDRRSPTREPPSELRLSADEVELIAKLQARDVEVRAHEAAHKGAGGALAGGASYSYERGPDGRRYAVGGEVPISLPGGGDPEVNMRQAQQVRRAALAPARPSGQDLSVASKATGIETDARAELRELRAEDAKQENVEAPDEPRDVEAADEPRDGSATESTDPEEAAEAAS